MIQLNLLPDVKLEYLRAQRSRSLMLTISALVTGVAIVLLVGMLSVNVLEKKHLKDLNNDIARETSTLKAEPQIDKILTVQNQLQSLTALHAAKPAVANVFDYLNQVTPTKISLSNVHVDFTAQSMTLTGSANTLSDVNQYVDTLKFTTYKVEGDSSTSAKAFKGVVLTSFGLTNVAAQAGTKPASYSISLSYDPAIFDITKKVTLNIPNITTTRASIDQAPDLFQATDSSATTGGTN